MIKCSVDIASDSRPSDIVWVGSDNVVHHKRAKGVPAIVECLDGIKADVIAVDAPSKLAIPGEKSRLCERLLHQYKIHVLFAPNNEDDAPTFMQAGFRLYRELFQKGYILWDKPGKVRIHKTKRSVIEIYPHAAFTVGLGYIPYKKDTLAGSLQRIGYLKRKEEELQLKWRGGVWDTISKIYSS